MKLPTFSLTELFESLQPHPKLAPAGGPQGVRQPDPSPGNRGGHLLFASGSDDDGYGGYDDDAPYEDPPQSTRRSPGAQRGGSGGSGNGGSGGGGRQRSVQFQPEERYWTEYLRIALPIIGLLLMIGLFWYWASQLTGDDNGGDEPVATETPGETEMITPASTPAPTEQVITQPTPPPAEAPPSTPDQEVAPEEAPVEEPVDADPAEEEPAADTGGFAIDDPVVINDDGVNMRDSATTEGSTVVNTLNSGDVLTILSGPVEADGYVWWEVIVETTNETGFVAEDFFDPAE